MLLQIRNKAINYVFVNKQRQLLNKWDSWLKRMHKGTKAIGLAIEKVQTQRCMDKLRWYN